MAKNYKEIRYCKMCKARFVAEDSTSNYSIGSRSYCQACREKYFKKKGE